MPRPRPWDIAEIWDMCSMSQNFELPRTHPKAVCQDMEAGSPGPFHVNLSHHLANHTLWNCYLALSVCFSSLTPNTESPKLSRGPSLCRAGKQHSASLCQRLAVGGPEPGTFSTIALQDPILWMSMLRLSLPRIGVELDFVPKLTIRLQNFCS